MYRQDVRDLKLQKLEANWYILLDFVSIYIRLRVGFPDFVKERDDLVELVQRYFAADKNESEVLDLITKCYGDREDHEGLDAILVDFDDMFDCIYDYCQLTFLDYEEFLEAYGDFFNLLALRIRKAITGEAYDPTDYERYRLKHRPIKFQLFDDSYKQKMLEMIPKLPEPVEEEF